MFSNFSPENRTIHEIMSKVVVVPERLQMTTWQRVACWISKATGSQAHPHVLAHACTHMHAHVRAHTTVVCNTDCFFMSTVSRTPLIVTLHVLCLLFIYYFSGLASVSAPSVLVIGSLCV
jgi:hypothetical protein